MTPLIEFLDVVLHGVDLIALSLAVGGVAVALVVLRPWQSLTIMGRIALRRSVGLTSLGGGILIATQAFRLWFQYLTLNSELGGGPLPPFLATDFARAGIIRMMVALGFTLVASFWLLRRPSSPSGWITLVLVAGLLMVVGAWLVHAASRIDNRVLLMAITVIHQLAVALWVGGILHLLALWRLIWGNLEVTYLWPQWMTRFSPLALLSVIFLTAAGIVLALDYVGSWQGLIGTGYGAMVLTKVVFLALALAIAAWNFSQVRHWKNHRQTIGVIQKLPPFLSAEAWVLGVALFSAAALTSLPPAVDTAAQQASPAEVAERFAPKIPRLVPPSREEYLAVASSVFDTYALPEETQKAQNEFNHNVAGVVVVVMALLALVDRSKFLSWARHWPLLFLGLAIFLFLFAEPTVWPLGPEGFWETLQVPAVLQHRLATLLVVALGLFEWRVRVGKAVHPQTTRVFPLLCMLGGALLLTHSHTVFALKSEFLIEINHAALGILAVVMGVGRWLELSLDSTENYWAGWVWRISFVLVGLLLLFYQEPSSP